MRTSPMMRLGMMGLLLIGLLIPLAMIDGLVSERAARRDSAAAEIGAIWGGAQTLAGPVLTVPYRCPSFESNGRSVQCFARAHFLPEALRIEGAAEPEVRHRSLFEVVVYRSKLKVSGRFSRLDVSGLRPTPEEILWRDATLSVGIPEPKGIARGVQLTWGGGRAAFEPGVPDVGLYVAGVQAPVGALVSPQSGDVTFDFEIDINGTRSLMFLPAGSESTVHLSSTWPHPSFVGAALPQTRSADATGFRADWSAPSFGRAYPSRWTSADLNRDEMKVQAAASAFGVVLLQPVDIYQQAERAVKYASLFIVMTFVIAFLWEITRDVLVHPVQYLFVGFAMCLFYLLLLSLSEHTGFDRAYIASATATVLLLGWYWSSVLRAASRGAVMALTLACLYGYLYLLLRLEDYSLLAGTVGLFVMLGVVMFATRRIDWYALRMGPGARPGGLP